MSTELGRQILEAVKAYVAGHVERVRSRVEQVAASLDELRTAVEALPPPQKGERGDDGHTPTADELRDLIAPLIPAPMPGPVGDRGEKGDAPTTAALLELIRPLIPPPVPGERGDRGERGIDGQSPTLEQLREIIKPLIPAPIAGERGMDGTNGTNGTDGANGRDALQLEILPAIDEARTHQRGTFARHAGGLWRAFESTSGMRGWECIVDGIADESETLQDDGRTLVRRTIYSSGRTFERTFSLAVVLDRGVFKSDGHYAPGDAVTWAGSVWIAQRRDAAMSYGKPGTPGSGWRLAVKAGRDARS